VPTFFLKCGAEYMEENTLMPCKIPPNKLGSGRPRGDHEGRQIASILGLVWSTTFLSKHPRIRGLKYIHWHVDLVCLGHGRGMLACGHQLLMHGADFMIFKVVLGWHNPGCDWDSTWLLRWHTGCGPSHA